MEATMIRHNLTAIGCSPWVDYVESHEGDSAIGLVMFVNCVATILANVVLFAVIFSNKELRDQVIQKVAMLSLKICSVSAEIFYEEGGSLETRSQINQSIKHPKGCSKFYFSPYCNKVFCKPLF